MTTEPPGLPPEVGHQAMGPAASSVLTALRDSVTQAREAVMAARRPPAGPTELKVARGDYLAAMLAYQQALSAHRLPIPRRLHDEVRLMRRLVSGADPAVTVRGRPSGAAWGRGLRGRP